MTQEEFDKILPMYIGQEATARSVDGQKLYMSDLNSHDLYCISKGYMKDVQLHLRPLSDITEEETEEWNKISTPLGEMEIESAMQIHWAKRINYYRSIGLDCDNLIESGFAIDKTEQK
jgi:hypothetical protein